MVMLITPNSKTNIVDCMRKIEFVLHIKNRDLVNVVIGV